MIKQILAQLQRKAESFAPDLVELFLQSGVYLDYARRFLDEEQIDEVDIAAYLDSDG